MTTPEEIRRDIEETRARLSNNVNTLGDTVSPGNQAKRQVQKVSSAVGSLKDKIFGTEPTPHYMDPSPSRAEQVKGAVGDAADSARSTMGDARSAMSDAAGNVQQAVSDLPEVTRRQAQGSPLVAGVIALGAGYLLGAVLPATQKEQEAAAQLKEKAAPLVDEAKAAGQELAQGLKEPAKQAAEQLKQTATEAVDTVKTEGEHVTQEVKDSAQQAQDNVKEA